MTCFSPWDVRGRAASRGLSVPTVWPDLLDAEDPPREQAPGNCPLSLSPRLSKREADLQPRVKPSQTRAPHSPGCRSINEKNKCHRQPWAEAVTAEMDGYIPGRTGASPPAGERGGTRWLSYRRGADWLTQLRPRPSQSSGDAARSAFWLLSARWPRFTVSCAGGLSLHRGGRRALQPPSCILLGPPQGRRDSLVAPRGEGASPRPVLGAPVTRPVCATPEASGNRVGGPTRSARSRKAPVPTGGRVSRRQTQAVQVHTHHTLPNDSSG